MLILGGLNLQPRHTRCMHKEESARAEVFKRFGMKKENITKAIKEAVILWFYSDARTARSADVGLEVQHSVGAVMW